MEGGRKGGREGGREGEREGDTYIYIKVSPPPLYCVINHILTHYFMY